MTQVSNMMVENLKKKVGIAELYRVNRDFESVKALFLGTFYQYGEVPKTWNKDLLKIQAQLAMASRRKPKEYAFHEENRLELLAVGYLGMARIYLDAAISEFNSQKLEKSELAGAFIDYQNIFTALQYLLRMPYTIHLGVLDWMGEYVHDSARYYQAIGESEQALTLLNEGIEDLETWTEEIGIMGDQEEDYPEHAGVWSTLGVLYARRGRLTGNLNDLITGFNYVSFSDHIIPNQGRKNDVAKMLLKESVKNAGKNNPLTTVRGLFLGVTRKFWG
jgi:hypothetical protein